MTSHLLDVVAALAGCTCDVCNASRGRGTLLRGSHRCAVCVGIDFTGTGVACPWCGRGAVKR